MITNARVRLDPGGVRTVLAAQDVAGSAHAATRASASSAMRAPVPGYAETTVASGFNAAIALDIAPDGRIFVAEQAGVLKVIDPNGAVKTVLDISGHVNSQTDRGLTGVAVDRNFASNGYVYLL